MPKINRNTLKNYFKNGNVPSQDQFGDLIDSTLNIIDEGFDKTPEEGLKVAQLGDEGRLISFFREILGDKPIYFVRLDRDEHIVFGTAEGRNVLSLGRSRISGADQNSYELDVGGVIKAEGRIGAGSSVPADGRWHDITGTLTGCHAFEVMAGVGGPAGQGRYALVHAFALNTFNPKGPLFNFLNLKKGIKYQPAYYRARQDKLRLRWHSEGAHVYRLQLKSNSDYGDGIQAQCYVTKLWFDETMKGSRSANGEADAKGAGTGG